MMESFGETSGLVDMVHLNDIKLEKKNTKASLNR